MTREQFDHDRISPAAMLTFRFGRGQSVVEPKGVSYESGETGVLGNGCSVESPRVEHDDDVILFAYVDRLLLELTSAQRHVLSLAFGDAGAIATTSGQYPSRRWRAVAGLTESARRYGAAWAAHRTERAENAPASERWVQHLADRLASKKQRPSVEERRRWDEVRGEAEAMIVSAEAAFLGVVRKKRAA